jgi:hypothetical protein
MKHKVYDYADNMQLHVATVYRRIKAGKLQTETIDGVLYVVVDDADNDAEKSKDQLQQQEPLPLKEHAISELKGALEMQQGKIEQLQHDIAGIHELIAELRQPMPQDATEAQQGAEIIMLQRTTRRESQLQASDSQQNKVSWFRGWCRNLRSRWAKVCSSVSEMVSCSRKAT